MSAHGGDVPQVVAYRDDVMTHKETNMAVTSTTTALGATLPDATLADAHGTQHRIADLADGKPLLLAFVCNHCPYVRHVEAAFGVFAREAIGRGVAVVAVVPNDLTSYPQDGPEGMREQRERAGWDFPYLLDEDHALTIAVGAVCTPDLFLYDDAGVLVHRGAFDSSTPGNNVELTGGDLRAAVDALLGGDPIPDGLAPSMGCGIKWAEGLEQI